MKRELSDAYVKWKAFFPICFFVVAISCVFIIPAMRPIGRTDTIAYIFFSCVIFAYFLVRFAWFAIRLKKIYVDEQYLYIASSKNEIEVPLDPGTRGTL